MSLNFDVIVIGAGAAGLMCAGVAAQRGLRVAVIDHSKRLAEKIRISGGGRCNFTNVNTSPANFISENPDYCRSALAAYQPKDFLRLIKHYRIPYHEKHKGQLFCDRSAEDIIQMLVAECDAGGAQWFRPCGVSAVRAERGGYALETAAGAMWAKQLVIASGGLSIPAIGATDFGYRIARQFDLPVVEPRAALVPLTFDAKQWAPFASLAGVALPVVAQSAGLSKLDAFDEDLLFTHRGLSGPAILQISSFWSPGTDIVIDLAHGQALEKVLLEAKNGSKQQFNTVLSSYLPRRLAEGWLAAGEFAPLATRKCAEIGDKQVRQIATQLTAWKLHPSGSEGYRKAEVTRGGVDTRALCSKTMQSLQHRGLFFIGEVVDVTGWLGGYNFQWAWASGVAAAKGLHSGE
jgi:hypothetical protein